MEAHTKNTRQPTLTSQNNEEQAIDRTGLLGYYFQDKNLKNVTLFAPTHNHMLTYDPRTADQLVPKETQVYQSIYWTGFIRSHETGDFHFSLSDDENAVIEIDGNIISQKGQDKQRVHLEKDKLVPIKIKYQPPKTVQVDSTIFKELKLFKINTQNQQQQVKQEELRNPAFNEKQQQAEKKSNSGRTKRDTSVEQEIESQQVTLDDSIDTDNDGIPNEYEEYGYTIKNKVAVPWDDVFYKNGYTKFISNPLDSHTVGDPYTDYEKAARDMDVTNAKETFHPLVAAFPSINVSMENTILSPNTNLSNSIETHSATNWSYSNTVGASIEAGVGPKGWSFGVSTNYQHTNTLAQEKGMSSGDSTQFNEASAGYLNANVRYNNVGTGSIYDVKPTTSFVLGTDTVATITAKSNTTALSLLPGKSYPQKGQNGIAINSMDDFNSHPITLNKKQVDKMLDNQPLLLETNQTEGVYKIKDINGKLIEGGRWNGVLEQIQVKTASLIVDTGNSISEKRVAAKDYRNPEDKIPSVSVKDALKLAYPDEITETVDGKLKYNGTLLADPTAYMTYMDSYTAEEVKTQINDKNGTFKDVNELYDVKLTPHMNFTFKFLEQPKEVDPGQQHVEDIWFDDGVSHNIETFSVIYDKNKPKYDYKISINGVDKGIQALTESESPKYGRLNLNLKKYNNGNSIDTNAEIKIYAVNPSSKKEFLVGHRTAKDVVSGKLEPKFAAMIWQPRSNDTYPSNLTHIFYISTPKYTKANYKLINRTKNITTADFGKVPANTTTSVDQLIFNPDDTYALQTTLNGKEYTIWEKKGGRG